MKTTLLAAFLLIGITLAGCIGGEDSAQPGETETEGDHGSGGVVTGRILDALSLEPIAGANVTLVQDDQAVTSTVTDGAGTYTFEGVEPGTYRIQVTSFSHHSDVASTGVTEGETAEVGFLLEPFPTEKPYDQSFDFRGLMTLGKHSPVLKMTCCSQDPNHQTQFNFTVDRPDLLRTIIVEVYWHEEHVGLHADLWKNPNCDPVCSPDHAYGQGNGFGNLSLRADNDLGEWPGLEEQDETLTVQMWPERDEEPITVAYQQEYEVYVQAFYVDDAPEGYVIRPDA